MPLQKSQSVRSCTTVSEIRNLQLNFMQNNCRNTFLNKFNAWVIKSDLGKVGDLSL